MAKRSEQGAQGEAARKMVGARLRRLRLEHNLTLGSVAAALDSSISTVGRMERGEVPLRRRDLLDLLRLYGVTDPYQQEALVSVAMGRREPGWWAGQDVSLEETVLWSHEQAADLVRTYQPHLVPELLRTEEYARAAHRAGHYPPPPREATEAAVKRLMRRQEALGATLWAVIDEPVLWRAVGGDVGAQIRQLDALAAAGRGVTIQILPAGSPYLPSCEPFTIFRLPGKQQIIALHRYTGDELGDLRDHEHHGLLFDQLAGAARGRADTPRILARIRDRLREHHRPGEEPPIG